MSLVAKTITNTLEVLPGFKVVVKNEDYIVFKVGQKSFGVDVDNGFNLTIVNQELVQHFDNLDLMMLSLLSFI